MITLSYGFKQPESGDRGVIFWPALEDNINQLNDHIHDGTTSAKLTSSSVTAVVQTILSANWVLVADGTYKQNVSLPGTMAYDDYGIIFKLSTGEPIYLTVEKTGASAYDVYINDNSVTIKAVYV